MEQYQYDASSVPFELWQNADDAVVELQVLGIAVAELEAMGCVVIMDQGVNLGALGPIN
ncbi:hypothetical protein NXS98_07255 [Fontisphaera persica]|uniref:hypothetical protein n=1 Tax=Fontisphaera persica TaxID=2974023 RepID=UPI0024BFE9A2|nr:hypothetical protein [Fontisphaera persica]WCJ60910.1 hypothetical protein NXS98_07255 [Fontisphaera persica]